MTIQGNDLYINKAKSNTQETVETRAMHSLIGTFMKILPTETDQDGVKLWPLKVIFPPGVRYRILYLKTEI